MWQSRKYYLYSSIPWTRARIPTCMPYWLLSTARTCLPCWQSKWFIIYLHRDMVTYWRNLSLSEWACAGRVRWMTSKIAPPLPPPHDSPSTVTARSPVRCRQLMAASRRKCLRRARIMFKNRSLGIPNTLPSPCCDIYMCILLLAYALSPSPRYLFQYCYHL